MKSVAEALRQIYDCFHSSAVCEKYFFDPAHKAEFVAYRNSMNLLQDSTESLLVHRQHGFSKDLRAYIEFWGLMQAVIIQQDSICEIHGVMVGAALDAKAKDLKAWLEVRQLRNTCAGHPAKKDKPTSASLTRTFMGRRFGNYDAIQYEKGQHNPDPATTDPMTGITPPSVRLGALLDAYAAEANAQLVLILAAMKRRWS